MEKPTLPKGTRDFGPQTMAKRQFILNTIRTVFEKFGFQPLETPAMEDIYTLTGKYGDEGDQLLFRILNSGDFFRPVLSPIATTNLSKALDYLLGQIAVKGLIETNFQDECNLAEKQIPELAKGVQMIRQYEERDSDYFQRNLEEWFKKYNNESPKVAAHERLNNSKFLHDRIMQRITGYYTQNPGIRSSKELLNIVSQKGLRYDLTVPFARYVVMNRHEIAFPFKRYQMQPVWRADRPQKGRYREFYQCDADVVGTKSLICEAEIILMITESMTNLGFTDFTIKINHRGVLNGVAELIGASGKETDLFVAIDKLEKIGEAKVREELQAKGFTTESLDRLFEILNIKGTNQAKLDKLADSYQSVESGKQGVADLQEVFTHLTNYGSTAENVELDIALARGLSYYTGCIFEVKINNVAIGSVSGGGRYDNLTATFGDKENLSGTGFSFGVDRLYDAMEELKLFPASATISTRVLICYFDEKGRDAGLSVLSSLREAGIASEIYPDTAKLKKQLDYANKKLIPYTIVIGDEEIQNKTFAFKNMETGEQESLTLDQVITKLQG